MQPNGIHGQAIQEINEYISREEKVAEQMQNSTGNELYRTGCSIKQALETTINLFFLVSSIYLQREGKRERQTQMLKAQMTTTSGRNLNQAPGKVRKRREKERGSNSRTQPQYK